MYNDKALGLMFSYILLIVSFRLAHKLLLQILLKLMLVNYGPIASFSVLA